MRNTCLTCKYYTGLICENADVYDEDEEGYVAPFDSCDFYEEEEEE